MMKNKSISFLDIDSIPLQIKDLLNRKLTDFNENIFSWENFETKIKEKSIVFNDEKRKILHRVLSGQLSHLPLTKSQKINLDLLQEKTTFTVTTGHQLNLFTGSTFFIYKILQTIKTAEKLKSQFPNFNFVPMFWLATEDHDFEEINFFRTKTKKYQIAAQSGGAVGRISIQDVDFIAEFETDFKNTPFGNELIQILKSAYQKGKTLTEATQEIVQFLFAERGLLFIDGDEKALKKQMISLFKDELLDFSLMKKTAKQRDFLTEKYGKVQVNPREINLFYLSDTRDRIVKNGDLYSVLNKDIKWTETELLSELENFPEKFSPNALMRPVFQEMVLPNLAYIGGNAEIIYWLELKDYFIENQLPYPLLIPRNSILFLEEKIGRKIAKLDLTITDFLGNISSVINEKLLKNHEILALLNQQEIALKKQFEVIKTQSSEIDVTFKNLVAAEETRQLKSFRRMRKRLLKAERKKHQHQVERIEVLSQKIHPLGIWQERVFNFSEFYAFFGKEWTEICYHSMEVENSKLMIFVL